MGEAEGAGVADAVLLAPLTEDSFVHNLHVRYKKDIIYTYVGNALVSVNPCRPLPLYSADLVRAYLARPPHHLPPHLYAVAASAYRWVRDRDESQCIVITGESGAGKTEAARVCLQCAVVAGGAGGALTAAGTLLEAFGNAATGRNHNASRFVSARRRRPPPSDHSRTRSFRCRGNCWRSSSTLRASRWEATSRTSRASGAAAGERNFHVLYQLLAGADGQLLKRLRLQRSWEQYRALRAAGAPAPAAPPSPHRAPAAVDAQDREHFAFTMAAMRTLGLGAGARDGVLRVLAFALKLCNVEFEPLHNVDGSLGARLLRRYELAEACALVGVDADRLALALGAAPAARHGDDDEDADDPDAADADAAHDDGSEGSEAGGAWGAGAWAAALRDRLAGALYGRLFTWLVTAANARIKPPEAEAGRRRALAILDVYGFEALARNGLERLLINYAAERVQAAVTGATLRREQELYAAEGLAWRALPFADHEAQAAALDALLPAVRELARAGAPDAALVARLARARSPRVLALPPLRFRVLHCGGPVLYDARGLLCAERDAVCRRASAALAAAAEPVLAALFAAPGAPAHAPPVPGGSPRRTTSLSSRQRALVGALVRRVSGGGGAPRLVRCVRADAALRPGRFDAALVRQQLRDQGVLDMAALRRAGWSDSLCAQDLLARYWLLRRPAPAPAPPAPAPSPCAGAASAVRAARALLRSLPIPGAEFAYGRTRVFIRSPRTVRAPIAPTPSAGERGSNGRSRAGVGAGGAAGGARGAPGDARAAGVARAPRPAAGPGRGRDRARVAQPPLGPGPVRGPGGRGGRGAHLALVVRVRAAPLRGAAVAPPAAAPRVARVRRVAGVRGAAAAGRGGRAAAAPAPRVALPRVPRRLRPDGAQPHAREGDGQRAVQGAQGQLPAQRGAPVRGRLRAPARVRGVAARRGLGRRPVRGVRRRGRQGGARLGARGPRAGRAVHGRAAAAGGALAARAAPRARAPRVPAVAVAAGRRPAGGAPARLGLGRGRPGLGLGLGRAGVGRGAVAVLVARRRRRARLPVRRGRAAPRRRRGAAHVPRAGAGHQAVPGGAERRGRAARRHRGLRVRGQLRGPAGDGGVPRGGRRGRGASSAPRQPHGRARVTPSSSSSSRPGLRVN